MSVSRRFAAALDRGRLNVTLHHNLFENIADRAPRARFGNIHAFNILVDGGYDPHVWFAECGDVFRHNIMWTAYRPARMCLPGWE